MLKVLRIPSLLLTGTFYLRIRTPRTLTQTLSIKLQIYLIFICPMKTIKFSNRKTPRKPWVTAGILKSIKTKDKMYKKYINKPISENNVKYTEYRNLLNNLLRTSKKSYITSEIESNKFNMKQTWKTLNNLLGRNKQTKLPDFFTNKGTKLAEKIPNPDHDNQSPLNLLKQKMVSFLTPHTQRKL